MTTSLATRTSLKSATDVFTLFQQMRTALVPWVLFAEPQWEQFTSIFRLRTVRDKSIFCSPAQVLTSSYSSALACCASIFLPATAPKQTRLLLLKMSSQARRQLLRWMRRSFLASRR